MGKMQSRDENFGLGDIGQRTQARIGKIPFSGRYHCEPRQFEDDYYTCPGVLGSGCSSEVRPARSVKKPGQKFAVKTLQLGKSMLESQRLKAEVENYLCIDHPHIARLYDVYESKQGLRLVMECMEGGELFTRIEDKKRFSEAEAIDSLRQMLLALNYIHSHGIVHRDVKLENFMYDKKNNGRLKLIDFGFSEMVDPGKKISGSMGTLAYVAPEVLSGSCTSQCDMWSLGICGFVMLAGYMPFSGDEAEVMVSNIQLGRYTMKSDRWDKISTEAKDFISSLLQVDPQQRLTADQALGHPFLNLDKEPLTPCSFGQKMQPCCEALRHFSQTSQFRRIFLEMMAWSLSDDEIAKVRDCFLSLDKNQKGTITMQDLKLVMVDKLHLVDEKELRKVFNSLDYNHDREIHYSDFLAAMINTQIDISDDVLNDTFRRFDTDASGYITVENLHDVLGGSVQREQVQSFIAKASQTSDDGRLYFPEFASYMRCESVYLDDCDMSDDSSDTSMAPFGTCLEESSARPAIKRPRIACASRQRRKRHDSKLCPRP
jgi:calcium-dependent protein kinase